MIKGAITDILEHMRAMRKTGLANPVSPLAPHMGKAFHIPVNKLGHPVTADTPIPKGDIRDAWGSIVVAHDAAKVMVDNYFIHAVNYASEPGYAGNPEEDGKSSIYWLIAASEKGVTKRIKYSFLHFLFKPKKGN